VAVGIDEVAEGAAREKVLDVAAPELLVVRVGGDVEPALADLPLGVDARDVLEPAGEEGEAQIRVHLPEPVGRDFREIVQQACRHQENPREAADAIKNEGF
jgi:hypothetical protein